MTLKQKTFQAIQWSYLSFFTSLVLTPLTTAILARILTKDQFGLCALGVSLYAVGLFIADFGIGQALVQKKRLTQEDIQAAFTSSLFLGMVATLLVWLVAPATGLILNNTDAEIFIRSYACLYIPAALVTVSQSLLRRELRFKALMIADVTAFIIGQSCCVMAALMKFGAFSFIIGAAVQYLIQFVVTYTYGKHPFAFTLKINSFKSLYSFGSQVSLISFLEFLSVNLDTFLISRFYGTAALGIYNRAYSAVYTPLISLARSLTRVLAASFSTIQQETTILRNAYLSGLLTLSIVLFSIAGSMFISAREIVLVLLGPEFLEAISIVKVLALFIPFPVLTNISAVLAEATAHLHAKIILQTAYLILLGSAYYAVYRLGWGIIGFASVLAVVGVLRSVGYAVLASHIIGGYKRTIVGIYIIGLSCGVATAALTMVTVVPLRNIGVPIWLLFGLELLLGATVVFLILLYGPKNEFQDILKTSLCKFSKRTIARFAR